MNEFDGIRDREGWRGKLKSLLDEAGQAARSSEVRLRFEVAERLTQFMERSFPNDEAVRALDEIASKAAVGLLDQTIDERLQGIVARNAELAALTKSFEAAAVEANETAAQLRLDRAGKALEALNNGLAALKELGAGLKKGSADDALIAEIGLAVDAAQRLRGLIERG